MNFNEELKKFSPLLSIENVVEELEKNDEKDVLAFLKLIVDESTSDEVQ